MNEFSNETYIETLRYCIQTNDNERALKILKVFERHLNVPPKEKIVVAEELRPEVTKSTIKRQRGNIGAEYIPGWAEIRNRILKRDSAACRICNKDYTLHVHHIDWDRSNNKDSNLVTLCEPCHRAVHREGYKPWNHDYPAPWNKQEINAYNQENAW